MSANAARGQSKVSGQIITESGDPAEFVNVLLLTPSDSTVYQMQLTEADGSYVFRGVEAGDYLLQVMGLSYSDFISESFTVDGETDLVYPAVRLAVMAEMLDAVEVVAKKPFLEQKAGRLVVNVDQSITGQGGTVTDLLKKVPGLVVVNNRIQMAGRSGVTILIDGRPTRYMDIESLLREMPADNIARIEVISQPGAAYDAEGTGGVINIILKKNALLGTNGNISLRAGYGELWKYGVNAAINHRSGPWNLSASGGVNRYSWFERLDLERILDDRTYLQSSYSPGLPVSSNLRLGADYDINDQHRVGISAQASRSDNESMANNQTELFSNENVLLSSFTTTNERERNWHSYTADAFYRWQIDTSGQELSVDFNMADYNRRAISTQMTVGADFDDRRNEEPADTRIYGGQIDYKLPLNDQWRLEAGTKFTGTRLANDLLASLRPQGGEWTNDALRTNSFEYDEDIFAGYGQVFFTKDNWEFNLGLRYEDSQAQGYSATLDSTTNLHIAKLFPSVSLTMPVAGPLGASVSYSYRIERPGYYDLNPFVYYLDPLTFYKGNPFLRPELTHSGQFSLTYEKQPFFNLSYDETRNVLTEVIEQDDASGEAFQTNVNLDKYVRYGGSLFFPLDFIAKPISGYGGIMCFYHDYKAKYLNADFLQDQFTVNGFLQVNVALPGDWKLEATGWLQGAGIDGIIRYETFYGLDAGVQKTLLNDQLRLQFSVDGIVQKFFHGRVDYQNLDYNLVSAWEAPIARLRATWNFGNQYLKGRENRRSTSDRERQRAQGE
ncbi:MAG: TonB-dependent receptor [Lewinella sp.]|nr:TonB-dependent receptor [Lewinella sp.]